MSNDMIPVEDRQAQASALPRMLMSREAQEVQGAIVMARQFPRDESTAILAINQACQRESLAKTALYAYPKGGKVVTGASIRLAEEIARCWGNIQFGIAEIDQRDGYSTMMAFCWDLQTNVRQTKVFQVPHAVGTKTGNKKLVDPRDIYETTANQGARRLRACILGIIPADIVEDAVETCRETLEKAKKGKPFGERVEDCVKAFAAIGVTLSLLEENVKLDKSKWIERHLIDLRAIYSTLRDNMAAAEDFFPGFGKEPPKSKPKAPEQKPAEQPKTKAPEQATPSEKLENPKPPQPEPAEHPPEMPPAASEPQGRQPGDEPEEDDSSYNLFVKFTRLIDSAQAGASLRKVKADVQEQAETLGEHFWSLNDAISARFKELGFAPDGSAKK